MVTMWRRRCRIDYGTKVGRGSVRHSLFSVATVSIALLQSVKVCPEYSEYEAKSPWNAMHNYRYSPWLQVSVVRRVACSCTGRAILFKVLLRGSRRAK